MVDKGTHEKFQRLMQALGEMSLKVDGYASPGGFWPDYLGTYLPVPHHVNSQQ